MSKPAEPIERPGMGGYFAYLNPPAAPVGDEQQDIEQANEQLDEQPVEDEQEEGAACQGGTDSSTSSSSTAVSTERGQTNRPKPARGAARRS